MPRVAAAALIAIVAVAACGQPTSPAPSAGHSATAAPVASVEASSAPTAATPTTASSPAPFDPAAVQVTLQPFATVPGGPLAISAPHDGSGRLFIASQDGRAWVVASDGTTGSAPFLDLRDRVTTGGERGLLGIAVHPRFPADPRVFVDYTDRSGNTVVASYRIDPADPDRLDPATAQAILHVDQPYPNHNGGALAFGPDGMLYVSLGDGGSGGDPQGNGQRLDTLLGKILRIDIDHPADGRAYGIPADNPFVDRPDARPEIWLYGLRNPWRMAFDRATGDLWIGDVGQNAWEELDVARAGERGLDFGWNRMEASHCFQPSSGCDPSGLTQPVAEYGHDAGCTIIGGAVYRGGAYPALRGGYLFADYCNGRIWAIDSAVTELSPATPVGSTSGGVSSFGEDTEGELYLTNLDGSVSRIVAEAR